MTDYTPPGPGEPGYPAGFLADGFKVGSPDFHFIVMNTLLVSGHHHHPDHHHPLVILTLLVIISQGPQPLLWYNTVGEPD